MSGHRPWESIDERRQRLAGGGSETHLNEIRARDGAKGYSESGATLTQAEADRRTLLRLLEIEQRKTASVRLLAEQIRQYADWPGIEDTATYPEVVQSLRVCAAGLVRALTPGGPQGATERHAHGLTGAVAGTSSPEAAPGPQRAAGDVEREMGRCPTCATWVYLEAGRISDHRMLRGATILPGDDPALCEGSGWLPAARADGQPERPAPPTCGGCGLPETNCACG